MPVEEFPHNAGQYPHGVLINPALEKKIVLIATIGYLASLITLSPSLITTFKLLTETTVSTSNIWDITPAATFIGILVGVIGVYLGNLIKEKWIKVLSTSGVILNVLAFSAAIFADSFGIIPLLLLAIVYYWAMPGIALVSTAALVGNLVKTHRT
ncbi:MAG TPA: hypothetical protein VLR89_06070, partial [Anaerolineaceae bacterium]|nr:hypothetical protein [Anaerolineaceae bacterium]HSN94611.1 hypothetical protein [Anaerolineaceae bacterium]